jgi:hypothetical protein
MDLSRSGAERNPYAEFIHALIDAVGQYSEDADYASATATPANKVNSSIWKRWADTERLINSSMVRTPVTG